MRRKHYAIGAAILTIGAAAAVVLLPKGQGGAGLEGIAYLPGGMTSPFSAPPAIKLPLAEIEAPVIPAQPKAPVKLAEVPTSAPVDMPPVTRTHRAQPPAETPTASDAPSDTPFVWHGSTGGAQSWKGTGGRAIALNNGPSTPSGGGGGGGGSLSASNHPLANPPSLPPSSTPKPIASTPVGPGLIGDGEKGAAIASTEAAGDSASNVGDTTSAFNNTLHNGTGLVGHGGSSSIVTPGTPNNSGGQGFVNGPAQYASYEAPDGPQLNAVTVDEPGALSILLVGALGLLVARRNKRTLA